MIDHPIYARICKDQIQLKKAVDSIMDMTQLTNNPKFPLEIILAEWKPKRTEQANRYLFGVVYAIISQETGNEVNDLHEYYLGEFFGWQEYEVMGRKKLRPVERSSKQVKARFSEFIEFIISRAATLGIVIPPPIGDKTW